MAVDYSQWLDELSKRSGASVEGSDMTNLQGKNPEDVAMFQTDLEAQYARRGASGQTGSGPEGSTVRAPSDIAKGTGQTSVAQQWISSSGGNTGGGASWGSPGSGNGRNQDPRADALYQQLMGRSQRGLAVDRNDPIIRAQADAYGANEERSRRNYLSDVAERQGPLANIAGESRMASERAGQRSGAFEAELMGRELTSRRQEIAQALTQMGGMLSQDQQAALTRELAALDAAIKREGLSLQGQGMGMQNDQFLRSLALQEWDMGNQNDYRWSGL